MSTIGYVVRGLPRTYGEVYRVVNRYTLGVIPLFGGFIVFWLVPGSPLHDAARALRHGEPVERASRPRLVALWAFAALAVGWSTWRAVAS